jgi:hypothetical protein
VSAPGRYDGYRDQMVTRQIVLEDFLVLTAAMRERLAMKHAEQEEPQSPYSGSNPLAFQIGAAAGAVRAWISARAALASLALAVTPAA